MLLKKVSRRLGTLLLGLCLLIGLASPAGAQTFPSQVGIGAATNQGYIDLYYNLGQPITPIAFPEATGGTGTLSYELTGGHQSLGFNFDPATRTLSGTPTLAGAGASGAGFQFAYAVDDAVGGSDTLTVYVTVCEGSGSPNGGSFCSPPAFAALAFAPEPDDRRYTVGTAVDLILPAATGGTGSNPTLLYRLNSFGGLPPGCPSMRPAARSRAR